MSIFRAVDMDSRKEAMVNVAKKIVDDINAMSFVNLDDQQLHSLMMMREIARGVVDNRVDKVSEREREREREESMNFLYFFFLCHLISLIIFAGYQGRP